MTLRFLPQPGWRKRFFCSHHSFLGGAHTLAQPLPIPLVHGASFGAWGPGKQQGWMEVSGQGWAVVQGCCSVLRCKCDLGAYPTVCVHPGAHTAPEGFQVVAAELGEGGSTGHIPKLWLESSR